MRKCIWCLQSEPVVSFKQRAHIIPQSLGAKKITQFECDSCNNYFGNASNQAPSVEHVFKEAFNITRHILLSTTNKEYPKFRSTYFNLSKSGVTIKPAFKLKNEFQSILCRQFKKGIYKIALEFLIDNLELGFEEEFNSVRQFVLHNKNQLPVYYYERNIGMILTANNITQKPIILPMENWKETFIQTQFFQFDILYHRFAVPLGSSRNVPQLTASDSSHFNAPFEITYLTDIDLTLNVIKNG